MPLLKSWIESANSPETDFPLNNLPHGVFSLPGGAPRCGVAIGEHVLDVASMEAAGLLSPGAAPVLQDGSWNGFMALGPRAWEAFRITLLGYLAEGSELRGIVERFLHPMADARLHLPFTVTEFTDFFSGRHHAANVVAMQGGDDADLPEAWLHMPLAYNARASSVVVSGTDIRRPWGQIRPRGSDAPQFAPSRRFDFELELGAVVGQPSNGMVSVARADEMIFGHVLLNDWSARDMQAWESTPLGPFNSKATATTISPWIVPAAALAPFRVAARKREADVMPYLREPGPMHHDIALEVTLAPEGRGETVISRTNARELYYSAAQQLTHHASSGCPMRVGDLLGSGTISGPGRGSRGSMLELAWRGREAVHLDSGEERRFLEDGDTVTFRAAAQGRGYRIGFGECRGTLRAPVLQPEFTR